MPSTTLPQESATNDDSEFREIVDKHVTLRKRAKLPHGRPLAGGVVKDGRWVATELSKQIKAIKIIKHRIECRERYRRLRDELITQQPEKRLRSSTRHKFSDDFCEIDEIPPKSLTVFDKR